MQTAIILFLVVDAAALLVLWLMARRAPEGWEDETGWHEGVAGVGQDDDAHTDETSADADRLLLSA